MTVPEVPDYLPDARDHPASEPTVTRAVVRLLRDLATDPRVPLRAKTVAVAAVLYVAPGVRRLVPRPPLATLADPLVLLLAARHLVAAAGYEVVRERWRGDDAGFVWLLVLTGIDA